MQPTPHNEFEVAVAADFTDWRTAVANEARTLFFLAAWRRSARRGSPRLRVVCLGEPPDTVQWQAARARASLTVQPLWKNTGTTDFPLHDWDVLHGAAGSGRTLLLASGVLVLRPLRSANFGALTGEVLAAAGGGRGGVPAAWWNAACKSLGVTEPPVLRRFGGPAGDNHPVAPAPWPSFDAGVVFTSNAARLLATWREHRERIQAALPAWRDGDAPVVAAEIEPGRVSAQLAVSTAAAALVGEGTGFHRLTFRDNARLQHFQTGLATFRIVRHLNLQGFGTGMFELSQLREFMGLQVEVWRVALAEHIRQGGGGWWASRRAVRQARQLWRVLDGLYQGEIRPAFAACGVHG